MTAFRYALWLIMTGLCLISPSANADQTDARLDPLFAQLKSITDHRHGTELFRLCRDTTCPVCRGQGGYAAGGGDSPVRGFAVTLGIGLIANLFTSVFVSRMIFDFSLSGKKQVKELSI